MFRHRLDSTLTYPPAPFHPGLPFPELAGIADAIEPSNRIYAAMRELLADFGLDATRWGSPDWNPFENLTAGARMVVVKPNLVLHKVGELACTIDSLVVHSSVLRVIVDYLILARRRSGVDFRIVIADTPLQSADFDALCAASGLTALMEHYRRIGERVDLFDLRFEWAVITDSFLITERVPLSGDPAGARIVDLGDLSAHHSASSASTLSIQDYDDGVTQTNHGPSTHRYKFSQTILDADVVINVPKLKCHAKAGVTLALKNIVGANVSKDFLPHFRSGAPESGGDEMPSQGLYSRTVRQVRNWFNRSGGRWLPAVHRLLKRTAYLIERRRHALGVEIGFGGGWYGNDTLWRTIVDINRVLLFSDRLGNIHDVPQRRLLCITDGIVGMEGNGPLKGTDIAVGLLAVGDDPVEMDYQLTALMGFDPDRVKHLNYWRHVAARRVGAPPERLLAKAALFREPDGWTKHLRK